MPINTAPQNLVFDIGGTTIKKGVLKENGKLDEFAVIPTPQQYEGLLATLASMADKKYRNIIIGIPGIYCQQSGKVIFAPNLPCIMDKHLKADLLMRISAQPTILIENDANMAALGEHHFGYDKKPASSVLITLGTGVGAGYVYNGGLLPGVSYAELGHMTLVAEGRLCNCGKRGCVERYCSVSALLKNYAEISGENDISTVGDIITLYDEGNFAAYGALDLFSLHLAHTLASLVNLLSPESIHIGGGLVVHKDYFFENSMAHYDRISIPALREKTEISISKVGNNAGLLGGAVLQKYRR